MGEQVLRGQNAYYMSGAYLLRKGLETTQEDSCNHKEPNVAMCDSKKHSDVLKEGFG
jgi:hypothetical protein